MRSSWAFPARRRRRHRPCTFMCRAGRHSQGRAVGPVWVTMATALVFGACHGGPARHDIAADDGRGDAAGVGCWPIGGCVKEKVLGAVRSGIRTIILPKENEVDLADLPEEVRRTLEVHPVGKIWARGCCRSPLRGAKFEAGHLIFDGDAPIEPQMVAKGRTDCSITPQCRYTAGSLNGRPAVFSCLAYPSPQSLGLSGHP